VEIRQVVASLAGGGDNSGVADCASNMLLVKFLHLTRGSVDPAKGHVVPLLVLRIEEV